jgi:hypothetical protein
MNITAGPRWTTTRRWQWSGSEQAVGGDDATTATISAVGAATWTGRTAVSFGRSGWRSAIRRGDPNPRRSDALVRQQSQTAARSTPQQRLDRLDKEAKQRVVQGRAAGT